MIIMKKAITLFIFLIVCMAPEFDLFAEGRINNIYIDKKDVFDSTNTKEWFFGANLMNSMHALTKSYYIEDELLFETGDIIDEELFEETERNLRKTGLFTKVDILIEEVSDDLYDVYVITQDKWSADPNFLFGTGGNTTNVGGRITEHNLAGTGTRIMLEGLHRSENEIGWQGIASITQHRLFRSELSIDARLQAHKNRTEQHVWFGKPFRTLSTQYSYGIAGKNYFGKEYLYQSHDDKTLMPFHERNIKAWFSKAWRRYDRVFATAMLELDDVERTSPEFSRAYDNSGKFLMAFSSVSQDYIETNKLNSYNTEDFPEGGWGTAILGKVFPIGSKGESFYYAGAQGERSWVTGNLYLFGQLTGGSAFTNSKGIYTYEEFLGLGFYRLNEDCLIAARIRQQTVWNWIKQRQLVLDNDSGLRGYAVNDLQGDNRLVANFEFRTFPDIEFWIVKLSGVLFYDVGTAWRQNTDLGATRWHNSIGFGFRIENTKTTGPNSILRIDFAYNFDEMRLGEIIFTSDQLFSVFKSHDFKLPEIYGREFDFE